MLQPYVSRNNNYAMIDAAEAKFKSIWSRKTIKQIEKELKSWRSYMDSHGQSYTFHGRDMTPLNCLSDGDKVLILKEILADKEREALR